ncbi:MAG: carboxypeptidase-like regulatory domain-containing protein [Planctomycetota bacterium]
MEGRFDKEIVWKGLSPGPYLLDIRGIDANLDGWKTFLGRLVLLDTSPVQEVDIAPEPWWRISGKVVAASDGRPIPHFEVSLEYKVQGAHPFGFRQSFPAASGLGNEAGTFCLEGLVPEKVAKFRVGARAEGFASEYTPWMSNDRSVPATGLVLALLDEKDAYAFVEGRVVREDGTPVPGAECSLHPPGQGIPLRAVLGTAKDPGNVVPGSTADSRRFGSGKSGPDGRFELRVRDPGDYVLSVEPPGQGLAPLKRSIPGLRPGGRFGPYRIVLKAGGELEVSVVLPPPGDPPLHLKGVSLAAPQGFADQYAPIQGTHALLKGLVPGEWSLQLQGWQGKHMAPPPGTPDATTLVLSTRKVRILPGEKQEIVFDFSSAGGGTTLEGRLLLPPDWTDFDPVVSVLSGEEPFSFLKNGGTDEEGHFVLRGIPDRKILLLGGGHSPIAGKEAFAGIFLESPGMQNGFLTLDATMPRVHGRIRHDGAPAPRVLLRIRLEAGNKPQESVVDRFLMGGILLESDDEGFFELVGLPAGRYSVSPSSIFSLAMRMRGEDKGPGTEEPVFFEIRTPRDVVDVRVDL